MKRYFIIPGALLAFILFSAKSCEDTEENRRLEEVALMETIDSVKDEFGAEYLNEESLFAFEQKAKQKLRDYADYLNIANDSSLDSAFRIQAATMTDELFYSRNVPVITKHSTFSIFIDSIHVIEPLHRSASSEYQGVLGFRLELREYAAGDTVITGPAWKIIDMVAAKTTSRFGNDSLSIWKVFLGDHIIP